MASCPMDSSQAKRLLLPVTAVLSYIERRGVDPGQTIFQILRYAQCTLTNDTSFQEVSRALNAAGYDEAKYVGHSFRIGAATSSAAVGNENSLIKRLGPPAKYHIFIICQNSFDITFSTTCPMIMACTLPQCMTP